VARSANDDALEGARTGEVYPMTNVQVATVPTTRPRAHARLRKHVPSDRAVYALRDAAHSDIPCGDIACQVCWNRIDAARRHAR
jgi:hypothetical protein